MINGSSWNRAQEARYFFCGFMNALRPRLFAIDASESQNYFVNHLVGIEADPFAVEISLLALTLADFPKSRWLEHKTWGCIR